jgi:2,5-dihydroxypyridine 5,6-dioxygenase
MRTCAYWQDYAEVTISRLMRPRPGDPLLLVTNTTNDMNLARACLAAALRAGADAQLIVKARLPRGSASNLGPIIANAIRGSRLILDLSDEIDADPATIEARRNGARLLVTNVLGVEEYVIRALMDVDHDAMAHDAHLVAELWNRTEHCRVTSPQGTDLSFDLMPRRSIVGDGALSEDGEVDFFPGAQVSIAPVEETINGTIVVDASDSVQGIVRSPYSFTMTRGVISAVEGGKEATVMSRWLESREDRTIHRLCHFSVGLNPQARISGNMIEDERMLAAVDFGFGYQSPDLGGTVGLSPYHMDVMLAAPTILLDGTEMSGRGSLNPALGFEQV